MGVERSPAPMTHQLVFCQGCLPDEVAGPRSVQGEALDKIGVDYGGSGE